MDECQDAGTNPPAVQSEISRFGMLPSVGSSGMRRLRSLAGLTAGYAIFVFSLGVTGAEAALTPATGSNVSMTCSNTTTDQGPGSNTGYGDSTQDGLNLTVQSGA